jgi:hypothetical protein
MVQGQTVERTKQLVFIASINTLNHIKITLFTITPGTVTSAHIIVL